ncbi:MAG: hypothetical protein ACYC3G_03530 [Minisyncoccota bacterium]
MVKNLHEASLNPMQQKAEVLITEEQIPTEEPQTPIAPNEENNV